MRNLGNRIDDNSDAVDDNKYYTTTPFSLGL
ncbi:hypothetical protein PEDI_48100 [Persicobacter diffluens]|uniref:Uncharacterized protein n=1 Tax=Persicobacter diffluens TaxID=981 RepID=A0AAN5APW2_9BACT|nr:hypothetical protein PEDI_48100 [Persicobacter diffluens]